MQRELFDQVTVTWPEVVEWVARVAGIAHDSPRFLPYVYSWSVFDKVAAMKLGDSQISDSSGASVPL